MRDLVWIFLIFMLFVGCTTTPSDTPSSKPINHSASSKPNQPSTSTPPAGNNTQPPQLPDDSNISNNQSTGSVAVEGVRYVSSASCIDKFGKANCITLVITCEGLAERQVILKKRTPSDSVNRTAILTTGGDGTAFYTAKEPGTVSALLQNNFEVYEVGWQGDNGWATGTNGAGFKKDMCAFAKVAEWIDSNRVDSSGTLCAHGNSGGSFQIAYGLSVYGLEDILDMVVLTGGPPITRLDVGCFGSDDPELQSAELSDASPLGLIDSVMGWPRYCANRSPTTEAIKEAQDTSIVSSTESRDYDYPNTKVNFVESAGDTQNADDQAQIYYDAVTSAKSWYYISAATHGVFEDPEGSAKIQELFLSECKKWNDSSPKNNSDS